VVIDSGGEGMSFSDIGGFGNIFCFCWSILIFSWADFT